MIDAIIATGLGPMPGTDSLETARIVVGELPDLPFLPQLPARGPWAAFDGRGSAFLAELHVDLQPAGWRFVPRPGIDERRRDAMLVRDLDAFEEALAGRVGPVKVAVTGPWSLAASLELFRGGRALGDPGAVRDLGFALAEGVRLHVAEVVRRAGSEVVVQIDEPLLDAVLEGAIATASGLGRIDAVPASTGRDALMAVVAAVHQNNAFAVAALPSAHALDLIRGCGFDGVALDLASVGAADDESIGTAIEGGMRLFAGVVEPGTPVSADPRTTLAPLGALWNRLGISSAQGRTVVVTPRSGLAACSTDEARSSIAAARRGAQWLASEPEEWMR